VVQVADNSPHCYVRPHQQLVQTQRNLLDFNLKFEQKI
jgi:hypothetical protein